MLNRGLMKVEGVRCNQWPDWHGKAFEVTERMRQEVMQNDAAACHK